MKPGSKTPTIFLLALASAGALAVFGAIGIGYSDRHTGLSLLAAHCLFGGLLMLIGLLARGWIWTSKSRISVIGGLLGAVAVFGVSALNIVLAWAAIEAWHTDTILVALLALPGLVGVAICLGAGDAEDDEKGSKQEDQLEDETLQPEKREFELAKDAGAGRPLYTLVSFIWSGVVQAATVFAGLMLLVLGLAYSNLLTSAIFDGGDPSVGRWLATLPAKTGRAMAIAAVAPVVLFGLQLFIGIFKAMDQLRVVARGLNSDREFGAAESAFVSEVIFRLEKYLADTRYPASFGFLYWGGFFAFLGGMLVALVWPDFADPLWSVVRHAQIGDQKILLYVGGEPAFSLVLGVFACIMLCWATFQASIFFAPRVAEYLHAREGWNSLSSAARSADDYFWFVVRQMRLGVWGPPQIPQPQEVIRAAFRHHEKTVFVSTAGLWAMTLVLGAFDLSWHIYFTDSRITYSDYWTLKRHTITYEEVDFVELACRLDRDGDLSVRYEVQLDESHSRTLADESDLAGDFEGLQRVDELLREAGVEFRWDMPRNSDATVDAAKMECHSELKRKLSGSQLEGARRVLHLD